MAPDAQTVQQRRRELLRQRIAESGLAATESADRPAISAGERCVLSPGQRRMWFVQAMNPADATLNICVAYRLTGSVDETRLRAAFADVVARHASLRTTYGVDAEGEPYQVFRDDVDVPWHSTDLSGHGHIEALAHSEFGRPFDLERELPLRITLARTAVDEFVLLLVVHHICWDDDCWAVFFTELSVAYNSSLTGSAPQYIAVEVLDGSPQCDDTDVGFWRDTLSPLPDPLELPGPPASNPSTRARHRTAALPADLMSRLDNFARECAATPFMVLLAAYGALIRRYTGATDFLVSVPVTERRAAAAGAIGYFGNTLLLRIRVRPEDTFAALVEAVRDTCLEAFAHQSVGIDRVVRELNPERSAGHDGLDRLVRLGFSMRKSVAGLQLGGVSTAQLELGAVTAPIPLALAVVADPLGMSAEIEYQTDVFCDELVGQLLRHYRELLTSALGAPGRRVDTLDLLDGAERQVLLNQSHGILVERSASTAVAALESAAAATPDAVAVVFEDTELSYAQVHARANRLAHWLIGNEIGPDDIVGLRMTTSVDFVVAVLAVLKAGAAYLPIDPAFPPDRIDYLLTDAAPTMVIGHEDFAAAEEAAAALPDTAPTDADRVRPLRPGHLAYVIYTSGSTGAPKGVAVPHHALAEHMAGFLEEWSLTATDRLLQTSSVSFDASVMEIFAPLSVGARLVVPKADAFSDVSYVAELISRHGVTVLHMVPSMLSTLLLLPQASQWRQLRHVPVGGEALPGEVADRFAGHFDATLRNHYGPTEAVICATHMPVEGHQGSGVVPIGVPNQNVYAYVLDRELQLVPAEVVGELYLGGAQLARGYLGRPGLTAQRFVADPFNPGMRLYRTGDLVRRNLAGNLEFVGRADEQVKVRGFRIELGEVESVIAAHPAVGHCLVLAEETEVGSRLVAYVVPATGPDGRRIELEINDIHAHAAGMLPQYMVPTAAAVIPEIPLTVHGKLDKRALPAPAPVHARRYRAPVTATERRVCSIFGHLFGLERVGVDDSFFDLGGHSLLAARLVAQIRAEVGVDCSVRTVFDAPTPAGLATRLGEQFRAAFGIDLDSVDVDDEFDLSAAPSGRPELVATIRPERPPLSYSQLAMWFQHRMRGANDVFNLGLTLRFTGSLDVAALTDALNDVVARHEALRTVFVEHEGIPYQSVHPTLRLDLPAVEVGAEHVEARIAELRGYLFDLTSGPLIRPTLLVIDPRTHVLVVLIHHIVTDHTSLGLIYEDLVTAYQARATGRVPQWEPLPLQFVDYALWQRDTFDAPGEWAAAELAHWCEVLAGLPAEIPMAADRSRPLVVGRQAEVVTFTVPAARRTQLTQLAEQVGASEFMVYEAALAVLLHRVGAGTDIAIGTPVASRDDLAVAGVDGPFANVLALRNDLSGDPSLRTALERCRTTVLDALSHQELPIDRLVEALNPPRSSARNHPFFQCSLHFRTEDWAQSPRELATAGTTVVPIPMEFEVSLLDLDVSVGVQPGGGLEVRILASADLYEPQTVRHLADGFGAVLDAFVTAPDRPVSGLELLPTDVMAALSAPPAPREIQRANVANGSPETERALIALLEELLEIAGVDREDNFFALGGDSVIAVQMSARANAAGLALAPAMVFEYMTIAEVAGAVDAATNAVAAQPVSPAGEPVSQSAPMSASGLDADALAALTASWQRQ
ncbi:MAG: amino acid adenylation domain-containing protein [Mycobacterium sp.]|nr:MAG: amino acid adenylation domain-containing protein [Mycobacterium sp.]